jgi:RNA polymerase sigma factor (sigma-70 family)
MIPSVSIRLLQTQSDARLVALARDGHERAFEALVHRYRRPLIAYGRRLLPAAKAEDAVQQGLFQAWLALQRGTEVRDVKPWLYQIVRNSALRIQRTSGREPAPLSEAFAAANTPDSDLERRIAARDALAGVAALPTLQREAMLQTAVDGRTHDQVAATLGLSDGAVRGLLYRARTTLRRAATAVTPFPFVTWAVHAGRNRAHSSESLLEIGSGAGAGSAGIAAVLAKGGAIAVTAGALVAGGAAVHLKLWPHQERATVRVRAASAGARALHRHEAKLGLANATSGLTAATGSGLSGHKPAQATPRGNSTGPTFTTQRSGVSSGTSAGSPNGQGTAGSPAAGGTTDGGNAASTAASAADTSGSTASTSPGSGSSDSSTTEATTESGSSDSSTAAATTEPGGSGTSTTTAAATPPPNSDGSGSSPAISPTPSDGAASTTESP